MLLNEWQVRKIETYLRSNGVENHLVLDDFIDHICCMVEQQMDSGLSFEKSFENAVYDLSISKIKTVECFTLKLINMEITFSSRISLLATIPFGLFGLYWAFSNAGITVPSFITWFVLLAAVLSMFGLLVMGWVNNFPRWSFPALGFCLLFSLFFMKITIPNWSHESLGFWALIPLIVSLTICVMFKPSIEPIKKVGRKIKEEPALILFAFYGFVPWMFFLFTDEIHSNWIVLVDIIVIGILSSGVYFFLKSNYKKTRILSMIIPTLLAGIITITASYMFWQ